MPAMVAIWSRRWWSLRAERVSGLADLFSRAPRRAVRPSVPPGVTRLFAGGLPVWAVTRLRRPAPPSCGRRRPSGDVSRAPGGDLCSLAAGVNGIRGGSRDA